MPLATRHSLLATKKKVSPFFSIIVPVYNVAPYLRECLDSVLAQTFTDWECVCIDDGATDGSGEILEAYARQEKRIRVIHQRNGGVSAARNRALAYVRGAYVTFLDGDDVIDGAWFAMAHQALMRYQMPEMVALSCQYVNEAMSNCEPPNPATIAAPRFNLTTQRDCMFTFWQASRCDCRGMCTRFVRRESLNGLRFDTRLTIGEDTVFVWDLMTRIKHFIACDYTGYFYRTRPTSAMHLRFSSMASVLIGQVIRLERIFTYYKTFKGHDHSLGLCPVFGYSTFYWRLFLSRLKLRKTFPEPKQAHLQAWVYHQRRYPLECALRLTFLRMLLLALRLWMRLRRGWFNHEILEILERRLRRRTARIIN